MAKFAEIGAEFCVFKSKGPSPITGILFQTNDVRLRGVGSKLVRLEEKSAFFDCCVWFCMTSRSFG